MLLLLLLLLLSLCVLLLLGMNTGNAACIASSRVNSKSTINVASCLIEFYGLPGVLSGLTNARSLAYAYCLLLLLLLSIAILLHVLNVPLDLVFTESQREIKLKSLVILPGRGLLKARLVGVGCRSRATIGCAPRIL